MIDGKEHGAKFVEVLYECRWDGMSQHLSSLLKAKWPHKLERLKSPITRSLYDSSKILQQAEEFLVNYQGMSAQHHDY
jgi:hypothetical protein